jgi:hypothetical protein
MGVPSDGVSMMVESLAGVRQPTGKEPAEGLTGLHLIDDGLVQRPQPPQRHLLPGGCTTANVRNNRSTSWAAASGVTQRAAATARTASASWVPSASAAMSDTPVGWSDEAADR